MNEQFVIDLYNAIVKNDPTFKADISIDKFKVDIQDSDYAKSMYEWVSEFNPDIASDFNDFYGKISRSVKKKELPFGITSDYAKEKEPMVMRPQEEPMESSSEDGFLEPFSLAKNPLTESKEKIAAQKQAVSEYEAKKGGVIDPKYLEQPEYTTDEFGNRVKAISQVAQEDYLQKPTQQIQQKAKVEERLAKVEAETPEYLKSSIAGIPAMQEKGIDGFVSEMNSVFGDAGFKFDRSGTKLTMTGPDGTVETISYGFERPEDVRAQVEYFVKTKAAPLNNVEKIERLYKDENKKYITDYQVEFDMKEFAAEQDNIGKEFSTFITEKEQAEKTLRQLVDMPVANRPQNYLDLRYQAENNLKRIGESGVELQAKIDKIKKKEASLKASIGKYVERQGKLGTISGATWNAAMDTIGGIVSGTADMIIDFSVETSPFSVYMSAEEKDRWKKDLKYGKEDELTYLEGARTAWREAFGSKSTTEQYEELAKQNFFTGAIIGVGGSLPAMIHPAAMYAAGNDAVNRIMENNPEFDDISEREKLLVKIPMGIAAAVLEKAGLDDVLKNSGVFSFITSKIIAKAPLGATVPVFRKVAEKEVMDMIANGSMRVLTGTMGEGLTGAAQEGANIAIQSIYNTAKGKKMFDTPDTVADIVYDILYSGAQEAIGGAIMTTPIAIANGFKEGNIAGIKPEYFEIFANMANDPVLEKSFIAKLKSDVIDGKITKRDATDLLNNYRHSVGLLRSMPEEITETGDKKMAMQLMRERKGLEEKIVGKDEAMAKPIKERIAAINEQLAKITENAIQKQATGKVPVQSETGVSQEMGEGVSESGSQVAPQETIITQEEVKRKQELTDALANTDTETITIGDETIPRLDAQKELDAITQKETAPVQTPAVKETIFTAATPEVKQGVTFMSQDGTEMQLDGNEEVAEQLYNEAIAIPEEQRTEQQQELIKGLKPVFLESQANKIDRMMAEQVTGEAVTDSEAMPTQEEVQFTEQDATRRTELQTALDTAGKNKRRDIYVGQKKMTRAEIKAEIEVLNQREQQAAAGKVETLDKLMTSAKQKESGKVRQAVSNAAKAIAKILPNVNIVVHESNDDYMAATGDTEGASGLYVPSENGGTIHINLERANTRTVGHETFHAILLRSIKTDAEAQKLAKAMLNAVMKSLKQTGKNNELLQKIEEFASNYEENFQNEEKLAEIFGYLTDGYPQLPVPAKSAIRKFIDAIAKMFGFARMSDADIVDMMNTLSRKVAAGEEITESDVMASKSKIAEINKRFQANFKDDMSGLEFVYFKNDSEFKKLENGGYITRDKSISDFNGAYMMVHIPDTAFSGMIYKNGELLVEGKGGVFYPLKFHKDGYFWASTSNAAKNMAKSLNEMLKKNNGKIYMALASSKTDKLFSSTTMSNAVLDFFKSKAFDSNFDINESQLKESLIIAANHKIDKVGLNMKLNDKMSIDDIVSEIQKKLNSDNSAFPDRKDFCEMLAAEMAKHINKSESTRNKFGRLFSDGIQNKYFKGVKEKKLKGSVVGETVTISKANILQALGEMLTEPMLKDGIDKDKGGQIYAILEISGKVEPVEAVKLDENGNEVIDRHGNKVHKHESYPMAIKSSDGNKTTVHILKDRVYWNDVFEDPYAGGVLSYDASAAILPSTAGITHNAIKLNTDLSKKDIEAQRNKDKLMLSNEANAKKDAFAGYKTKKSFEEKDPKKFKEYSQKGMPLYNYEKLLEERKKIKEEWNKKKLESKKKGLNVSGKNAPKKVGVSSRQQKSNVSPRKQIVGENAMLSKEVRDNLDTARKMEQDGVDIKNIRIATGWERGADKKWRYEVQDGKLKVPLSSTSGKLSDILDSDELFELYPNLKDINVDFNINGFGTGSYNSNDNTIIVNGGTRDALSILLHEVQHAIQKIEGFARGGNKDQLPVELLGNMPKEWDFIEKEVQNFWKNLSREERSRVKDLFRTKTAALPKWTMLRPIDVEDIESAIEQLEILNNEYPSEIFTDGINILESVLPDIGEYQTNEANRYEKYKNLSGEVESRNVQKRMDMTQEQRKGTTLQETEDVAREDQLLFFNDNISSRKQKASPNKEAEKIVQFARTNGFDDEAIEVLLKRKGFTDDIIAAAMGTEAKGKIEVSEDMLPGYDKLMSKVEGVYERSMRRGATKEKALENAIASAETSPQYEAATDQQREQIIRNIREMFGKKEKKAPSKEKITGKPKDKKVIINDMSALKGQIQLEIKAAKSGAKSVTDAIKAIVGYVNKMSERGNLTRKDLRKIINLIPSVKNQKSLDKAADAIYEIINNATTDIVEVSDYKAMKTQIKLEAKAAKFAAAVLNMKRKILGDVIRGLAAKGKVTAAQVATIVNKISKANLDNPDVVQRVIDYAIKVFSDADYGHKVSVANKLRAKIKALGKNANKLGNLTVVAKRFAEIDPEMMDDIDAYIDMAMTVAEGVSGSRMTAANLNIMDPATGDWLNVRSKLKVADILDTSKAMDFITKAMEKQAEEARRRLAEKVADILGMDTNDVVDDKSMTYDKMMKLLAAFEAKPDERIDAIKDTEVRKTVERIISVYVPVIEDMLTTGINPVTGQPLNISEQDAAMIREFMGMDLSKLKTADVIRAVDMLNNFVTNGSIAGMGAIVGAYRGQVEIEALVDDGTKAHKMKSYHSPLFARSFYEAFASLPLFFEKMFKGTTKAIKVMKAMGITSLVNHKAAAAAAVEKVLDRYIKQFNKRKPNGKAFQDISNIIERGIIGDLGKTIEGSEKEIQAEFDKRKKIIVDSIDVLRRSGTKKDLEMASAMEAAYNKIARDSKNIDEVRAKADKINVDAVNFWINEWDKIYNELEAVTLSVYNRQLQRTGNYVPDRYVFTGDTKNSNNTPEDPYGITSSFVTNSNIPYKKSAGSLMEKEDTPDGLDVKAGKYVNLSFDSMNAQAMLEALIDVKTAMDVRQVKAFMDSDLLDKVVEYGPDREALKERVVTLIRNVKNKRLADEKTLRLLAKKMNRIANLGAALALAGPKQMIQQTVPLMFNTMWSAGVVNFFNGMKDVFSGGANKFIDNSGMGIALRGIDSVTELESLNRKIETTAKTSLGKAIRMLDRWNQRMLNIFLSKPDVFIARASWLAFYRKGLKKYGADPNIDWSTHEINQEAADYAQMMLDRKQNISDKDLAGTMYNSGKVWKEVALKVFIPFSTFRINQTARMGNDLTTISSATASMEDKVIAARSMAGMLTEMATFRAISLGASFYIFYGLANWLTGGEEEEEEINKKWNNLLKGAASSAVADLFSPIPNLDEGVKKIVNAGMSFAQDLAEVDEDEKYSLFTTPQETWATTYGMFGIAADRAQSLFDNIELYRTGKFKDQWGNEKIIPEKYREAIGSILWMQPFVTIGLIPAPEINNVINNTIKISKKEAKTQKQMDKEVAYGGYKTLEEFKKNDPEKYEKYSEEGGELYKYREAQKEDDEPKDETELKKAKRVAYAGYDTLEEYKKNDPRGYERSAAKGGDLYKYKELQKANRGIGKRFRGMSEEEYRKEYPKEYREKYGPGTEYYRYKRSPQYRIDKRKEAEEKRRKIREAAAEKRRKRYGN